MKSYYYEINGYIKGVTQARNKWDAKRHCKELAKTFCPNAKIKSIKIEKIRMDEPLVSE